MESKLSLIDLAGSERASATNNRGVRLHEGANINKSLLALANCINTLASNSAGGKKLNVKYRDSRLTHLLKSSLEGGNCNLVMIANINPSHVTFEDSHNTLKCVPSCPFYISVYLSISVHTIFSYHIRVQ